MTTYYVVDTTRLRLRGGDHGIDCDTLEQAFEHIADELQNSNARRFEIHVGSMSSTNVIHIDADDFTPAEE